MKNPEKKETLEKKKTVDNKKGEEPKDNSYVRLPWFGLKKLLLKEVAPQWAPCFD